MGLQTKAAVTCVHHWKLPIHKDMWDGLVKAEQTCKKCGETKQYRSMILEETNAYSHTNHGKRKARAKKTKEETPEWLE